MNRLATGMIALTALAFAAEAEAADPKNGKTVFDQWCYGCHEPMPGRGIDPPAGTYTLQERYKGSIPAVLEERKDLTGDYIKTLVRHGINVMPKIRKSEVTDAELDDIVAYLTGPK